MIDPTQQQAAPSAAPSQEEGAGIICIAPQSPGLFAVYQKGGEPSGEPVGLDEALDQARAMLGDAGTGAPEGQDEAAALIDGFKGARGQVGG